MKEFDIEKLERKNIYKVPDHVFENIQDRVMHDVKPARKAPIFKMNWAYAAAASLALIFGATFVFNSDDTPATNVGNSKGIYAENKNEPKTESEIAYETLKSDVISVDDNDQDSDIQDTKTDSYAQQSGEKVKAAPVKAVSKKEEKQVNEYLDSFSNSEISELASNSTQDVYLDLYN